MTSTDRCACKHTGYFHRSRFGQPDACRGYVKQLSTSTSPKTGSTQFLPCPCKGFREAPTS